MMNIGDIVIIKHANDIPSYMQQYCGGIATITDKFLNIGDYTMWYVLDVHPNYCWQEAWIVHCNDIPAMIRKSCAHDTLEKMFNRSRRASTKWKEEELCN